MGHREQFSPEAIWLLDRVDKSGIKLVGLGRVQARGLDFGDCVSLYEDAKGPSLQDRRRTFHLTQWLAHSIANCDETGFSLADEAELAAHVQHLEVNELVMPAACDCQDGAAGGIVIAAEALRWGERWSRRSGPLRLIASNAPRSAEGRLRDAHRRQGSLFASASLGRDVRAESREDVLRKRTSVRG